MPQVVTDKSHHQLPFVEPARHCKVAEDGITNEIKEERRPSAYFVPVPPPMK